MQISVIIPAYNEEKCIGRCISSILSQTFPEDYEIIVVNDFSNDKTSQVVSEFQKENKNLILIDNKKRMGIATSRNKGFKLSTGKIVAFIDANCVASEKWLINILYSLQKKSAIIGPVIPKSNDNFFQNLYFQPHNIFGNIFNKTGLPLCSAGNNCAFLREFFSDLGGYNDILLEDFDIAMRAAKRGSINYEEMTPVFSSSRRISKNGFLKSNIRLVNGYIRLLIGKPAKA